MSSLRRIAVVGASLAIASAPLLLGAAAVPSGALTLNLQVIPTTTQVSITPGTWFEGQVITVTLRATVGPTDLFITPTGSVTFTEYDPQGDVMNTIGPVALSQCLILLRQCTASLTETINPVDIPTGTYTIKGSYSGGFLSSPSTGSTTFRVVAPS